MALLDTHSIVEELITVGFDKKQAEAITRINVATHDKLATKYDVELVRRDLDLVKVELKNEIALVRKDVDLVRTELKTEIDLVIGETKSIRSEISTFKWVMGLGMAIILMMLSLVLSRVL